MRIIRRALPASAAVLERWAWILLFAFFALNSFRALISLANPTFDYSASLTGLTWNQIHVRYPGLAAFIDGKLAESSIFLLGFSIFGMAMSAFSYRRRELWAWFAMWYTIIFVLGVMALAKGAIDVTGLAPAMLVIVLLGLLLPVRTFFRRKSDQGAA